MLDLTAVKHLMTKFGISVPMLATRSGLQKGAIYRILNSESSRQNTQIGTIQKLAIGLNVPIQTIIEADAAHRFSGTWNSTWDESNCIRRFHETYQHANQIITINPRVASPYLFSATMFRWSWAYQDSGFPRNNSSAVENWVKWSEEYIEEQQRLRRECDFHETVIGLRTIFLAAATEQPDSIDYTKQQLLHHKDHTALCLLDKALWNSFTDAIRRDILKSCGFNFGPWEKIAIVDEVAALIRYPDYHCSVSFDHQFVVELRKATLKYASAYSGHDLSKVNTQTLDYLSSLLKKQNLNSSS